MALNEIRLVSILDLYLFKQSQKSTCFTCFTDEFIFTIIETNGSQPNSYNSTLVIAGLLRAFHPFTYIYI